MNHYGDLGLIKVSSPLERFAHTVLVITWGIMAVTGLNYCLRFTNCRLKVN